MKPVVPTGLTTANLQSEADLGSTTWTPPTAAAAAIGMQSASPVFTATTRTNPLNWSLQAVAANPKLPGAYPLVGFSFFDLYQCYSSATNASLIRQYLQLALLQRRCQRRHPRPTASPSRRRNWLLEIQALAFGADRHQCRRQRRLRRQAGRLSRGRRSTGTGERDACTRPCRVRICLPGCRAFRSARADAALRLKMPTSNST